jgi:hypothetical protein
MYLANVHRAYVTNDGSRAERFADLCFPLRRRQLSAGTRTLLNSTVRIYLLLS